MCVQGMNENIQKLHNSNWLICKQGTLCQLKWISIWSLCKELHPQNNPISATQGICTLPPIKKNPMLGTTLRDRGCCAEENGISQHSCFSSPADANYSLLNVNWGYISPTQKSSRNGPVVFTVTWEQKALPPSKSCICFSSQYDTDR